MFRTRLTIALFVSIFLIDAGIGFSLQQARFDLGGLCSAVMNVEAPGLYKEIADASKNRSGDRLIELEKRSVRDGCAIQYRWRELANVFVQAGREQDALRVLEEMDSRDFDLSFALNPSPLGERHDELKQFMGTAAFGTTPVGLKIEGFKKISDERRARYVEILGRIPSNQRPPEHYIAKGACPFECCRFGNWTAMKDTDLVAAPDDKRVVGRATKGSRVDALTGEVHLRPEPVLVLIQVNAGPPKDSIAFALDYQGEGYQHIYTLGNVVSVSTAIKDYCFRPSELCWAETLETDEERREPVWWVKIRLSNGVVGWTDKADQFDGKDGCA